MRIVGQQGLEIQCGMREIVRAFGLTARAVRFYEERGLVETERDHNNNRRFDGKARARLHLIAALRRCGLGLADIEAVLDLERVGRGAQLDLAIAQLKDRRAELQAECSQVDAAIYELSRTGEGAAVGRRAPRGLGLAAVR